MICLLSVMLLDIWWADIAHQYHSCGSCEEARVVFIKEYHVPEPHIRCLPLYKQRAITGTTSILPAPQI